MVGVLFFFFFQAEDGIRDLVRSRGLGDVYKRQGYTRGEFGHNDFYPVAIAAAQVAGWDGRRTLLSLSLIHI